MLQCKFLVVGEIQTNCYIAFDDDRCFIVDPGDECEKIVAFIEKKELSPQAVLLTHGHFDHIGAADSLRKKYNINIYASKAEKKVLNNPLINLSGNMMMSQNGIKLDADVYLDDGQVIEIMDREIRCILTPGHTEGGMCFYLPSDMILFSGDTLFQESVGRTDFPGGSMSEIIHSIREKLFVLPEGVRVYPGHGIMTTIGDEKMYNPYAAE